MTQNEWGYVDPVQRAHQQERSAPPMPGSGLPQQPPYLPGHYENIPEILYGNGPQPYHSPVKTAAIGAGLGVVIQTWLRNRKARRKKETE